jgi:hypothetical protein
MRGVMSGEARAEAGTVGGTAGMRAGDASTVLADAPCVWPLLLV